MMMSFHRLINWFSSNDEVLWSLDWIFVIKWWGVTTVWLGCWWCQITIVHTKSQLKTCLYFKRKSLGKTTALEFEHWKRKHMSIVEIYIARSSFFKKNANKTGFLIRKRIHLIFVYTKKEKPKHFNPFITPYIKAEVKDETKCNIETTHRYI